MALDSELSDMLAEAYKSTEVAAKLFFPERFTRPFSWIHREIFAALDDPKERKIVIAAPRGIGKTSIMQLAYPAKKILFRDTRFLVTVSKSATHAQMQSENLKLKLTNSPIVKALFGTSKSRQWSKDMWLVDWSDSPYSTMRLPRGGGKQVRGVLHEDFRPDLIIVDDFEDDEEVLSEDQRKKKRDWFYSSLINVVDRGSKDWKIVYIDTVKHEDCLLVRLLEDEGWTHFRYEIGNDKLESNWPEFMSTEELKATRNEFEKAGQLDKFYMEYYNIPISIEESGFRPEFVKYYTEGQITWDFNHTHEGFVIVDPAKSVNPRSAETAILGGCIDVVKNRIYFRELVNEKLHPNEIYEEAFKMCKRMHSNILAIETTSLSEFITFPLSNEIIRRGLGLQLIELKPREKKENRAKALIPFYRLGQIYHQKGRMTALEQQMFSFPRPRRWDCLDVAAYVVELLEIGSKYFQPPDMLEDSMSKVEKEYEGLNNEMDNLDFDFAPNVSFGDRMANY